MQQKRIRTSRPEPRASDDSTRASRLGRGARSCTACAAAAVALGLTGCGGEERTSEEPPPPPALPAQVAEELASASDAVADALAVGDVCGAAHRADELNGRAIDAVNAGQVPPELQEELLAATNDLVDRVNCPPPPVVEEDDEGEGEGESKDEDENKDEQADESGEGGGESQDEKDKKDKK